MLTPEQSKRLHNVGFTQREIERFREGKTAHNLNTGPWQSAMKARRDWLIRQTELGHTKLAILAKIIALLHTGFSPWDFLKIEYYPPAKIARKDFVKVKKRRAEYRLARQVPSYTRVGPAPRRQA